MTSRRHDNQVGVSDHDIVVANINVVHTEKGVLAARFSSIIKEILMRSVSRLKTFIVLLPYMVEALWSDFKNTTLDAMDSHIPSKLSSTRHNLPWVDRSIKRAINKKQCLYNKARSSGSQQHWDDYKTFCRSSDRQIRKSYWQYFGCVGNSLEENDTKHFWHFIKARKQHTFGAAGLSTDNGTKIAATTEERQML